MPCRTSPSLSLNEHAKRLDVVHITFQPVAPAMLSERQNQNTHSSIQAFMQITYNSTEVCPGQLVPTQVLAGEEQGVCSFQHGALSSSLTFAMPVKQRLTWWELAANLLAAQASASQHREKRDNTVLGVWPGMVHDIARHCMTLHSMTAQRGVRHIAFPCIASPLSACSTATSILSPTFSTSRDCEVSRQKPLERQSAWPRGPTAHSQASSTRAASLWLLSRLPWGKNEAA